MATVRDIVTAALQKATIIGIGDEAEAQDAEKGLEAFNFMLSGWKLDGVNLEHTDLDLADAFPLANEFREGTVYLLASRLSPDYSLPQGFDADRWFDKVRAAYMTIDAATIAPGLTRMPSQYWNDEKVR